VDLADPRWDVGLAVACLSEGERTRAMQAVAPVRRRRILLRAALRHAVGQVLGEAPEQVVIGNDGGRPVLVAADLEVSCSAHGNVALLAVADCALGVDVTGTHGEALGDAAAEGWLAPEEVRRVAGLPRARQSAALARCWAQKEAVLKAEGVGLARDPATVVTPPADHGAVGPWWLSPLPVPRGHVAALATRMPLSPDAVTVDRLLPGGAA